MVNPPLLSQLLALRGHSKATFSRWGGWVVGQMSMIVHVRWVGGLVNVHVDKIWKKTAMLEETLIWRKQCWAKPYCCFQVKILLRTNYLESCNHDYILRTKFGYKAQYDEKGLNRERKFEMGGFMNVHVDIGRWSMKCPCLSTWGGWVVRKGQNLVHVVFERPLTQFLKQNCA